jgi:xanthine dehydrogenase large subunit
VGAAEPQESVGKSKAVGEPPFNLGISALLALSHAVEACGDGSVYPDLRAPATAEAVLAAVERVRAGHDFSAKNRGGADA